MRPAPPLGGLALVLALAGHAAAAPTPDKGYSATVTRDSAEVRCQPSAGGVCYVTNVLRRGDRVKVLGDADVPGWLKIEPPAGSFSWINTRFVHQPDPRMPHYVVVPKDGAGVRIGSSVVEKLPQVKGCDLQQGAIVQRYVNGGWVGRTQVDTEGSTGTWLPIVPPPGEVRYLRKEAVASAAPALPPPSPSGAAPTANPPGVLAYPPQVTQAGPAPAALPADPEALLLHAEKAEQASRIPEAIGLYGRVVSEASSTRPDLSRAAQARLAFLVSAGRPAPPPPQAAVSLAIRGEVPGTVVYAPTPDGRRYRPLTDTPDPPAPLPAVRLAPPAATEAPGPGGKAQGWTQPAGLAASAAVAAGESRLTAGTLRTSGRSVGGVRAYALQPLGPDGVLYYVVPRGVDLERYVGQKVEVSGPAVYKGELRANCIEAVEVRPLP